MKPCGGIVRMMFAAALMAACRGDGAYWAGFRAPAKAAVEHVRGYLWMEAEAFDDYGTWIIDTQFVGKMGSAYLLGAGVTNVCAPATTRLAVPRSGTWRAWARSRDWIPEFHPGRFALEIGGMRSADLGDSGRTGWVWQKAGDFSLSAGETDVRLVDLTGWFARCDAILLTTDLGYVPPDDPAACEAACTRFAGLPPEEDCGAFDVVVVGAGPGGSTAAIQSARAGVRTLLVHDRPVMGGNASSEFRIPPRGAGTYRPDHQEGGIDAEMLALARGTEGFDWTDAYQTLAAREKNLTAVPNVRIVAAETGRKGEILSVTGVDTLTGARRRWRGRQFVDATGDGWLGFFAGARYRFGSEGRAEFNEPYAPEKPNGRTMSGSIFSGLWSDRGYFAAFRGWKTRGAKFGFTAPEWANLELPPWYAKRRVPSFGGAAIEHPHEIDDVADPEYARDYLIRMSVCYWNWAKNLAVNRADGEAWQMVAIPHTNARREGRRLIGDYILTECDEHEGRMFEDAIGYGGYPITTHDSAGSFGSNGDYNRPEPAIYGIPYRCIYSVNVPNLLMCGRCCSATHRALGSLRVQSTCAVTGQAAGLAAANCVKTGLSPRDYGKRHIRELQAELRAYGQKIPEPEDFSACALVLPADRAEIVAAGPSRALKDAAAVLSRYLGIVFEEKVPIVPAPTPGRVAITLVEAKDSDGYSVVAEPGSLVLEASDPSWAVYVFLERVVGVRFFWPGLHGTALPRLARLGVKPCRLAGRPDVSLARWRAFADGAWKDPKSREFERSADRAALEAFFREWPTEGAAGDDHFWRAYGFGGKAMRAAYAAHAAGADPRTVAKAVAEATDAVIGGTEEWWRIRTVAHLVFGLKK